MENINVVLNKIKPHREEMRKGLCVGYADHPDLNDRPIHLEWETLTRHGLISGMTGSGKGAILTSMLDHFLKEWTEKTNYAGFTHCDPHSIGNLLIINRLQELERTGHKVDWDKVRCYKIGGEYPVALNLISHKDNTSIDEMVKETTEIILQAFENPQLSQSKVALEASLHALLWDKNNHTIADIQRLFRDDLFLREIMKNIGNPLIKEWFTKEVVEAKKQKGTSKNLDALVTRIFPFVSQQIMQRSYCQQQNVIDGKRIMDNGEIVLFDFKGAPEEAYKLTAGWIANHYFKTAIKRTPYGGRKHFLIFDEAQMFRIKRLRDIVQQTRKFGLGLWLMTQNVKELDTDIREILTDNSGFIFSLKQKKGLKEMSSLMGNKFSEDHIQNLPDLHAALSSRDGSANVVVPPPAFIWQGQRTTQQSKEAKYAYQQAEMKFNELMKRDCKHVTQVDREIQERTLSNGQLSDNKTIELRKRSLATMS
jgi:5'(3')-deoxyribonucleotidase